MSTITDAQIEAHMTMIFKDEEVPQVWFKRADVLRIVRAVLALAPVAGGVPAFYINPKIIDPATGQISNRLNCAITWSNKPTPKLWSLPVYLTAPASPQSGPDYKAMYEELSAAVFRHLQRGAVTLGPEIATALQGKEWDLYATSDAAQPASIPFDKVLKPGPYESAQPASSDDELFLVPREVLECAIQQGALDGKDSAFKAIRSIMDGPASSSAPAVGGVELLQQALAALDSCGSAAVEDGGQQWFDDKLVDAAHAAITAALAAPAGAAGQDALSWCAAALQAAIPWDEQDGAIRLHATGETKTISEILDMANAALAAQGDGGTTA